MYPDPNTDDPTATFKVYETKNFANSLFYILYPVIYSNTGVPVIEWIVNNKSAVLKVTLITLFVNTVNLEIVVVFDMFKVQEKFIVTWYCSLDFTEKLNVSSLAAEQVPVISVWGSTLVVFKVGMAR